MTGRQTLGDLLRRKMSDYGYTLDYTAKVLRITTSGLHNIIEGHVPRLSDAVKYRICLELDVDPMVLEEVLGEC